MKPEIKKQLILNAPYLLFVYLFDKLGEAVRLAPGADASQKLLHMGEGFTAAFKEFSAKKLTQEKKPSIRKLLSTLKEAAQGRNAERAKVKNKDREVSL